MARKVLHLLLLLIIFTNVLSQKSQKSNKKHRSLAPHPLMNSTTKNIAALKIHNKLLQTVYSDSFSKNYYYTTLYVGHNRVRQTYIIDTASSIMASPCSPCSECGQHKNPLYYDIKRAHKPLKCSSKICQLTPTTSCLDKKSKFLSTGTCSFKINRASGEGIMGYFMKDIVYLETDKKPHEYQQPQNLFMQKKTFRSYALPIGCTTAELGKYKELATDGIMGMNNNPKSFISLLYNLKIVNRNLFSLCFGLRGGYMSLGEIDKTHHKSEEIEYVPLLSSNVYYLIKLNSLKVGPEENALKTPVIASIDTGNSISYFPSIIYKQLTNQFKKYCDKQKGKCGNFTYDHDLGYCASFPEREPLFKAIYEVWPNITLQFGESEYIWKPINYYYYQFSIDQRKACLGFNYHSSEKVILGANFIHGHDIIFDRGNQRLGFVPADCSRGNLIWNRYQQILGKNVQFEMTDPVKMDKEIHHGEIENTFNLGDTNRDDMVEFIQGHNTELDRKEVSTVNYIILISSIIIVGIVVFVVLSVLLCSKKKLTYEQQENEYTAEETPNEINTVDDNNAQPEPEVEAEAEAEANDNKISFEDNNPPENNETNLEDSK